MLILYLFWEEGGDNKIEFFFKVQRIIFFLNKKNTFICNRYRQVWKTLEFDVFNSPLHVSIVIQVLLNSKMKIIFMKRL